MYAKDYKWLYDRPFYDRPFPTYKDRCQPGILDQRTVTENVRFNPCEYFSSRMYFSFQINMSKSRLTTKQNNWKKTSEYKPSN